MRLAGRVALITGAGSGMGKAMAEMFAAEGAKVVCADISGKQDDVAAAIGSAAVAVHADVARRGRRPEHDRRRRAASSASSTS